MLKKVYTAEDRKSYHYGERSCTIQFHICVNWA